MGLLPIFLSGIPLGILKVFLPRCLKGISFFFQHSLPDSSIILRCLAEFLRGFFGIPSRIAIFLVFFPVFLNRVLPGFLLKMIPEFLLALCLFWYSSRSNYLNFWIFFYYFRDPSGIYPRNSFQHFSRDFFWNSSGIFLPGFLHYFLRNSSTVFF